MNRIVILIALLALPCVIVGAAQGKQPIPDAAQIKDATQDVRALFDKEYADPAVSAMLAARMLDQLPRIKKPADQYVCCTEAYELAKKSGDTVLSLRAVDSLDERFDGVDTLSLQVPVLIPLSQKPPVADQNAQLFKQALEVYLVALARDDKDGQAAVEKLIPVLRTLAAKNAPPSTPALVELLKEGNLLNKKKGQGLEGIARAKALPSDGAANEAAGRWLCFALRNWPEGLPYLARAAEPELKRLAELELGASDVKTQVDVAKQWAIKSTRLGLDPLSGANIRSHARQMCAHVALLTNGFEREDAQGSMDAIDLLGAVGVVATSSPPPKARQHQTKIVRLAFTPDNAVLISLSEDGTLVSWDVSSGSVIAKGKPNKERDSEDHTIENIIPGPSSRFIVLVSRNGFTGISGTTDLSTFTFSIPMRAYEFSRDGSMMVAIARSDGSAIATTPTSSILTGNRILSVRPAASRHLHVAAFAPNGKIIVGGYDDAVSAYVGDRLSTAPLWTAAAKDIRKLRVSPDGKSVWACEAHGQVWQFDMITGSIVNSFPPQGANSLEVNLPEVSPDTAHFLAWNGNSKAIEVWDPAEKLPQGSCGGTSASWVCWLADSLRFLWADSGTMHLADLHGKDITTFEAGKAAISRIAVSPNGLWAATGSFEGDVRIWPLPMSKPAK
jgi:WD40 repeat protein